MFRKRQRISIVRPEERELAEMNKRKSGFRQYESDHASVTTYFHQWWQEKEKLELKHFKERKIPGLRKILFEKNLERQTE